MSQIIAGKDIHSPLHHSLLKQVEAIARQILQEKDEVQYPSLFAGKAGIALLYAYLHKIFPGKNYLNFTMDYLDELSESLANDELSHNLSAGIAGIGFVFQHLRNIGVLDISDDWNLSELDEFLSRAIELDFKNGFWDNLHGLVGVGAYFLERNTETGDKKYLEKIIEYLAAMRIAKGEYKLWISEGYLTPDKDNYNFGMAHGMPGILSFLARVYARGIKQGEIEDMITLCLPFLLLHEYPDDTAFCFPIELELQSPKETKPYSRLGWCYGDLCMANALIHCGHRLSNEDWKRKGIEVALKTTRRTLDNSGCVDASFCHGSVGLLHQYSRLYELTDRKEFKIAAENWLAITQQQFYKPGEGIGGYFYRGYNAEQEKFEWVNKYGLLEGSCGIALVYLSYLFNIKPDWDIIFLTNV